MCIPLAAIGVASAIGGSLLSAYGQVQAGKSAAAAANYNAGNLRRAAADAEDRGEVQAQQLGEQGGQLVGAQRARYAASGLDTASGSPLAILMGTAGVTQQDILTTKNNAAREAWGYRTEASLQQYQGRAARRGGYVGAAGTLLTGAAQAASIYKGLK